jgi:histone acetyltransferase (RNA polymerase elongator complex component)
MKTSDKCLIYPLFIPNEACPGTCVYCDQSKITGAKRFDLDQAARDVQAFVQRNPGRNKEIAFYGGTFTAMPLQQQEIFLHRIHALLDASSSIRISTHPLFINAEVLTRCKMYRVKTIELGIQDFCEVPLKRSGRNYSPEKALAAAHAVREAGFILGVQLIPGLPSSDQHTLSENQRQLLKLRPDLLRLYPLIVIRDTVLAKMYHSKEYHALSIPEAVKICADYAELCDRAGIRIIKYGLPSNLDPRDVIAGPYHPAFGELVQQEILIRRLDLNPVSINHLDAKERQLLKAHACQYLSQKRHEICINNHVNQAIRS